MKRAFTILFLVLISFQALSQCAGGVIGTASAIPNGSFSCLQQSFPSAIGVINNGSSATMCFRYYNVGYINLAAPINANPNPATAFTSYLVGYSGTFTLPPGINGDIITISDYIGRAGSALGFGLNPLTIVPSSTDTIQGTTSLVLNTGGASVTLGYYNGRWTIINS